MIRLTVVAAVLASGPVAFADDKPGADPRAVAERYAAAALAGKVDDAAKLAVEGQSPGRKRRIEEFRAVVDARAVKLPQVFVGAAKGQAIAVSEVVQLKKAQPDGTDRGHLVFALVQSGGKWLVRDIDFRAAASANDQIAKFKKKHPDARELPTK